MKLSISLPQDDVVIIDDYARVTGLPSRSAALHVAVQMLRLPDLEADYAAAWREWEESGEEAAWDNALADGLADAAR